MNKRKLVAPGPYILHRAEVVKSLHAECLDASYRAGSLSSRLGYRDGVKGSTLPRLCLTRLQIPV